MKMSGNKVTLVDHALTPDGKIGQGRGDVVAYLECEAHDLAYKFKAGWFYLCCMNVAKRGDSRHGLLVVEVVNCVNH